MDGPKSDQEEITENFFIENFEELYRDVQQVCIKYAAQYRISPEVAEELVQNIFIAAWKRRSSEVNTNSLDFRDWLFTIAKKVIINYAHFRQQERQNNKGKRPRALVSRYKFRLKSLVISKIKLEKAKYFTYLITACFRRRKQRPRRYPLGKANSDEEASPRFPRHVAGKLYLKTRITTSNARLSPNALAGT